MVEGGAARQPVAWGQLALATLLAGIAAAYLFEARGVSRSPDNLLLLQPTAIIVLVLYVLLAIGCFRRAPVRAADAEAVETEVAAETWAETLRSGAMVASFGVFILTLELVGYDVAIWAFTTLGLYVCGERNKVALLVFPPVFTALMVLGFRALVPYPFPTTIL